MSKNTPARRIICAASAVLLTLGVIFGTFGLTRKNTVEAAAITDANIEKMEDEIKKLTAEQNTYLKQLSDTRESKSAELEYKAYLDAYLYSTQTKITLAEELAASLAEDVAEKTSDIEAKQAEYDEQYAMCLERLQYAYEEGNVGYLELILDSKSLTDFLVQLERVTSILEYDRNMLSSLETEKNELEAKKEALQLSLDKQKIMIDDLEKDKADYEIKAKESEDYLQTLAADESAKLTLYYAAKNKEEELDRELTDYIKELQAKMAKAYVGGEFNWPLDPSIKRLSSDFGPRYYNGIYENHGALDIPAPSGTSIYASNAGTVIKAEFHYSYGNYILIDHGGGKSTLYAHCSALLVSAGQDVTQGQTIGRVGTTGYSGGNHLHFEFRVNGVRDDPKSYVSMPDGWYLS